LSTTGTTRHSIENAAKKIAICGSTRLKNSGLEDACVENIVEAGRLIRRSGGDRRGRSIVISSGVIVSAIVTAIQSRRVEMRSPGTDRQNHPE
jgi:hypothetical protein